MRKPYLLQTIESDETLKETLDWPFDFRLEPQAYLDDEWPVKSEHKLLIFGSCGTGGVFTFWGEGELETLPIVYISSEGEVGKISDNLSELFSLIVFLNCWFDLTKYSGADQLNEMREQFIKLKIEILEDEPDFREKQRMISLKLKLKGEMKILERFHEICVAGEVPAIFDANDGTQYDSIFIQN